MGRLGLWAEVRRAGGFGAEEFLADRTGTSTDPIRPCVWCGLSPIKLT